MWTAHQLPAVALPVRHLFALRPAACHRLLWLQIPAGAHSTFRPHPMQRNFLQACCASKGSTEGSCPCDASIEVDDTASHSAGARVFTPSRQALCGSEVLAGQP